MPVINQLITRVTITGDPMFDYFFTLVLIAGLVAFGISSIVKIGSRS